MSQRSLSRYVTTLKSGPLTVVMSEFNTPDLDDDTFDNGHLRRTAH